MKLSMNWLKEFVEIDKSPEETATALTFLGFETKVLSKPAEFSGVVTGKVLEKGKHPNADKLSLCKVTDGTKEYQVVCGAQNVEAGQVIAFAMLGAELPGGFKIERRKIRNIESEGMICSAKELGLKEESEGIMVLEPSTALGKDFREILSDGDSLLDLETTTSRPDCLSHVGVARELSAFLGKPLKFELKKGTNSAQGLDIEIKEPDLCSRYIGVRICNVKVGPSPAWLAGRLAKCGIRSINNIVDITNYVMLELGQPLHAFDLSMLKGEKIVVRKANNEKIHALDGKEYTLVDEMLVIADSEKPQAIAGVTGGEFSGVTEKTRDIILESAVFNPVSVRRASKKLGLSTDASYRLERGVGWDICEAASLRATELILDICGGQLTARKDVIAKPFKYNSIELRAEKVKRLLGLEIAPEKIKSILSSLGMNVKGSDEKITAEIPSWRNDCAQEVDLIEEIARLNGYDKIPVTVLPVAPVFESAAEEKPVDEILAGRLVSFGFCQAVNYSFTSVKVLEKYEMQLQEKIANPLSLDNEALRVDLLCGLMQNLENNIDHEIKNVKLFEIGNVFKKEGQRKQLGIMASGSVLDNWWKFNDESIKDYLVDVPYMQGIVKQLLCGQHVRFDSSKSDNRFHYFHPGKWCQIFVNGRPAGQCGAIHPRFAVEKSADTVYAMLDIDALNWNRATPKYEHIKRFPIVKRDLSLTADKNLAFDKIEKQLNGLVKKNILLTEIFEDMSLFSRYEIKEAGKTSYSFHLTFQHSGHTLSEKEINEAVDAILQEFKNSLGMTLRA